MRFTRDGILIAKGKTYAMVYVDDFSEFEAICRSGHTHRSAATAARCDAIVADRA